MILLSLVALTVMGSFDWRSSIRVQAATNEVCARETLALSNCSRDDVVVIDEARYGRIKMGRCFPTSSIGHFNCSTDVSSYVDALCSGRKSCNLTIDETLENSPHHCPAELKGYLEIRHRCLKVEGQPPPGSGSNLCQTAGNVFRPESTRGYLSPALTDESGIGTSSCPWTIEVKSGQMINLTLLDFGIWKNGGWTKAPGDNSQSDGTTCTTYGRIIEKTRPQETPLWAGRQRQRWLYLSNSNSIQIIFNRNLTKSLRQFFLIKYEVVGCADPVSPPRTIVVRKGDNATLRCDDDGDADLPIQWTLRCVDGNWSGWAPLFNCSNRLPHRKMASDATGFSLSDRALRKRYKPDTVASVKETINRQISAPYELMPYAIDSHTETTGYSGLIFAEPIPHSVHSRPREDPRNPIITAVELNSTSLVQLNPAIRQITNFNTRPVEVIPTYLELGNFAT